MSLLQNSNAISAGGYDINNSLRFRQSASAFLSRTPASASNRQIWTWSGWVKRGRLGVENHTLFAGRTSASATYTLFYFSNTDTLNFLDNGGASLITTQLFRDPSAWYHIVLSVDTTQATAANRVKMYINGNQITAFSTATYPTLNANLNVNTTATQVIGENPGAAQLFDGYMAEINFIDGQALTPSSFGETDADTGSWKPKAYTGTYGTNGFYLKFSDIATTSGSNAGLGKDFSTNTNYLVTNNISTTAGTTYDAMTDSPTLTSATVANYAVMNPLTYTGTLASANLDLTTLTSYGSSNLGTSTIEMSTGSWYWEVTKTSGSATTLWIGVVNSPTANVSSSQFMYGSNGTYYESGSTVASGKATYATNDVIGIALNASTKAIEFFKNGVSQGSYTMSLNGPYFVAVYDGDGASTCVFAFNFGQRPFSYTPPTGFVALNTYNLPDSTIKKGNTVMDATLYTGNGTYPRSLTNTAGFKPDLVWTKARSVAYSNVLYDSVRGTGNTKNLSSDTTSAEPAFSTNANLTSFDSNGWSVDSTSSTNILNNSGTTFVGWQWQAGQGSTSSNTSGSITSTVSVNATAGFSVVTWAAQSTARTVGHGLGVAPSMIIIKDRSSAIQWFVYHASIGAGKYLTLNTTAASVTNSTVFSTAPTSSVFDPGTGFTTGNGYGNLVAYCWAEIAGFSKFGSYTGNGSANGPFVYLGFRPKFVLVKASSSVEAWYINDSARDTYNPDLRILAPNLADAEFNNGSTWMDLTSNGFKVRYNTSPFNTSGATYIYMAFAENPFKNSNAR